MLNQQLHIKVLYHNDELFVGNLSYVVGRLFDISSSKALVNKPINLSKSLQLKTIQVKGFSMLS